MTFETPDEAQKLAALAHVEFAIREAAQVPGLPTDLTLYPVARVAVIGAGTMGGGIAMAFANIGLPVTLIDIDEASVARGIAFIAGNYAHSVKRGKLTEAELNARTALITGSADIASVADADLIIEAAFEDMAVKLDLFSKIDAFAHPRAILATNTSGLDIDEIALATGRPEMVIGAHFFSPANVMRLLEVVWARKTDPAVVATLMNLGKRLDKVAVVARVHPGFIGNAMLAHYFREAIFLVEEGATPRQVDKALTDFGYAMGFYTLADMSGNDVGRIKTLKELPSRPKGVRYPDLLIDMWERERLGQKSGVGFYRYEKGDRTPIDDPELDEIIAAYAKRNGIVRREISSTEILERCILGLINEGANLIEKGVAQRPSDIDAVYVTGYGFPAWRGGPLYFADQIGLANVVSRLEHYRAQFGDVWEPVPLLKRLASEGRTFAAYQHELAGDAATRPSNTGPQQ